jgi:hypothetical protein
VSKAQKEMQRKIWRESGYDLKKSDKMNGKEGHIPT